jgi:hypothetical protein
LPPTDRRRAQISAISDAGFLGWVSCRPSQDSRKKLKLNGDFDFLRPMIRSLY